MSLFKDKVSTVALFQSVSFGREFYSVVLYIIVSVAKITTVVTTSACWLCNAF